jgi:hypothetical protein
VVSLKPPLINFVFDRTLLAEDACERLAWEKEATSERSSVEFQDVPDVPADVAARRVL